MKNYSYLVIIFLCSCVSQIKTADRPELSKNDELKTERTGSVSSISTISTTGTDLNKYAYELGYEPEKGLTEDQKKAVELRAKVRAQERTLDTMKERIQYSKVLPYFNNDQEKSDFLSIPSIEGRQAFVNRNKIMSRAKTKSKDFIDAVDAQDIVIGMTQDLVKKSWGEPESVEYSGHPVYKNEKWRYIRDVPTTQGYKRERRYVYFEGGKVVGWETE